MTGTTATSSERGGRARSPSGKLAGMDRYDYIVIGAGSAGCVLAGRLTEDPTVSVLLLEAGPPDTGMEVRIPAAFPKLFKGERDWDYATTPQPALDGRELYWPRGKMLGGCSSMNAQMYVRGNPADFDGWAAAGNPGWSWADVLPYFKRSERFDRGGDRLHGGSGPLRISHLRDPSPLTRAAVAAFVQAGFEATGDVNGPTQEGVALSDVNQRRGRRWSAADAFLRPARKRSNLTVRTGALATSLVVEGGRARGVRFRHGGRDVEAEASAEVLLSGGAVNSPQLLLLSGIGPADQLAEHGIDVVHELPGVGANLHDHLAHGTIFTVDGGTLLDAEKPLQLANYLGRRKGMLTSNVGEAMAFCRSRDDLPAPDLQLIVAPVEYIDHGLQPPPGHGITIGGVLLQPASRGRVTLASADPAAKPLLDADYLGEPGEVAPLVHAVKLARTVAEQPALKGLVTGELLPGPEVVSDEDIEADIRRRSFTLYHPVGTCAMGPDPAAGAVVDAALRVHGVDGLRVVDASVMPTITRGNTNAPTIMIAEKAVALIRGAAAASRSAS